MPLIKCNLDAMYVIELNLRWYILKARNKSYQMRIIIQKHVLLVKKILGIILLKMFQKLYVYTFFAIAVKPNYTKYFPSRCFS